MLNWLKANWPWLAGVISSLGIGLLLDPIGYWRRLRDRNDTENISASIERNKTIREEMKAMHDDIIKLQQEVRNLSSRIHNMEIEKAALVVELESLRNENRSLRESNRSLRNALDQCEQRTGYRDYE